MVRGSLVVFILLLLLDFLRSILLCCLDDGDDDDKKDDDSSSHDIVIGGGGVKSREVDADRQLPTVGLALAAVDFGGDDDTDERADDEEVDVEVVADEY